MVELIALKGKDSEFRVYFGQQLFFKDNSHNSVMCQLSNTRAHKGEGRRSAHYGLPVICPCNYRITGL